MSFRILSDFDFDSAAITSSSEVSGYDDDYVVDDAMGLKWRTTGCASEWIEFNISSDLTEVGIFGHNLSDGATVKLYNGAASPANNLVGSFTWSAANLLIFKTAIGSPLAWWRITFEDAGNPDGYIEIGRICGGAYFQPDQRFSCGARRIRVDPSLKNLSKGRDLNAFKEPKYSVWELLFDQLDGSTATDDQRMWETIFEDRGLTEPVAISLDCATMESACRTTKYGLFITNYSDLWQSPCPTFQVPVGFAELA